MWAHGFGWQQETQRTERTLRIGLDLVNQVCDLSFPYFILTALVEKKSYMEMWYTHFLYLSATLNVGVWRHLCLGLDFKEGRIIVVENGEHIADISHYL